jgi:uncharacterized protein YjbI with pentapeptide repeats
MPDEPFHEDETFENLHFAEQRVPKTEYLNCTFVNGTFSKTDWSNSDFVDCIFRDCNLTLAVLKNTGLKNVTFEGCKLMGVDFGVANSFLFAIRCTNCVLDYASFHQRKMKKTVFTACSMKETDFTGADLTGADLANCDLTNAIFEQTVLEKADFRTARNIRLDPERNRVKGARFAHRSLPGLLSKYDLDVEWE